MFKLFKFALFPLFLVFSLSGCSSNSPANLEDRDIFQYKDSYVGDNSAVINITSQLTTADDVDGFEIQSKEEPFGLIIYYDWLETDGTIKTAVIHDASYLFALIHNVDWIVFEAETFEYEITRENLEDWYGEELSAIQNEKELIALMQNNLEHEEKVHKFYLD